MEEKKKYEIPEEEWNEKENLDDGKNRKLREWA